MTMQTRSTVNSLHKDKGRSWKGSEMVKMSWRSAIWLRPSQPLSTSTRLSPGVQFLPLGNALPYYPTSSFVLKGLNSIHQQHRQSWIQSVWQEGLKQGQPSSAPVDRVSAKPVTKSTLVPAQDYKATRLVFSRLDTQLEGFLDRLFRTSNLHRYRYQASKSMLGSWSHWSADTAIYSSCMFSSMFLQYSR